MNIYNVKNLKSTVLDFDKKNVKIAIAKCEVVDYQNEIIDKHAFDTTLNAGVQKWHFINHNPDLYIGKFSDLFIENDYLVGLSELNEKNSNARNLLLAYEKGEINEHSIGYKVIKKIPENEIVTRLIEIRLFEGSSLTVPAANPDTPFLGFKSLKSENDIITEILNLTEIIFSKRLTAEEVKLNELKIKQLHQKYRDMQVANCKQPSITKDIVSQNTDNQYFDKELKKINKIYKLLNI